jgi:hypothetical protein
MEKRRKIETSRKYSDSNFYFTVSTSTGNTCFKFQLKIRLEEKKNKKGRKKQEARRKKTPNKLITQLKITTTDDAKINTSENIKIWYNNNKPYKNH